MLVLNSVVLDEHFVLYSLIECGGAIMDKYYQVKETEKAMQRYWEKSGVFTFSMNHEGEIYSIDTPPPTISGSLHIGHIFSYTQAEMIARFRRMQGYNVFYPFGFDDNGLPTERLVEREKGIRAKDLPRNIFIELCQETVAKYEAEFKVLWNSLGFSCDWTQQYETVNPMVQRISQRSFIELAQTGKAYMKDSPVLWCTQCQTSIAQAELDNCDVQSAFVYVPFMVEGEQLPVATTRPELLYGCVCLFVNPDDERYSRLVGKAARVPLYEYDIPILTDELADPDKGTGVVMCATFGDSIDVQWVAKHCLPYRHVILPDGRLDNAVPYIGGLPAKTARKTINKYLVEKGLLLKTEAITHTVATHERCGTEIEIIPSRQWYIDVLTEKERYLKAADEINWYPAFMKNRYIAWVENLKWDWCISRQRYFGVPFPVWYCVDCGTPVFAQEEQLPINPLDTVYNGTCECGCTEYIPETAVFDTWATSSLTPFVNARTGEPNDRSRHIMPMSMRTQAHEIIRTWAFYTIVRSLHHTGMLPWKDIMICGFVLAKKGEKISKSKSNSEFSPISLIETHSADVIRYWSANTKLGTDTFFDPDELPIAKRFITKLWNASKFSILHLQDIDFDRSVDLLPIDQWILERVRQTTSKATDYLNNYEIGAARHEIDDLFWKDFCDNYIEVVKERLYMPDIHGLEQRRSGQYALYHALFGIIKLYAPYVPHITEFIYQEFFKRYKRSISIHLLTWDKPKSVDEDLIAFGENIKRVIYEARKHKADRNVSMREPMEKLVISMEEQFTDWLHLTEKDIRSCTRANEIIYRTKK